MVRIMVFLFMISVLTLNDHDDDTDHDTDDDVDDDTDDDTDDETHDGGRGEPVSYQGSRIKDLVQARMSILERLRT